MFTGIVETTGRIAFIKKDGGNLHFGITAPFLSELKIDQSVSHNGVCLTVAALEKDHYLVTAIAETLRKTNLGDLKADDLVNLERCVKAGDRLDGHIVQGHVDTTGICTGVKNEDGSRIFSFSYEPSAGITVAKGSICVNGVSLTVVDSNPGKFSVAVIPYTFDHTNFRALGVNHSVNLEFDIIGKYIAAMMPR
jgi:riboflavin synthase